MVPLFDHIELPKNLNSLFRDHLWFYFTKTCKSPNSNLTYRILNKFSVFANTKVSFIVITSKKSGVIHWTNSFESNRIDPISPMKITFWRWFLKIIFCSIQNCQWRQNCFLGNCENLKNQTKNQKHFHVLFFSQKKLSDNFFDCWMWKLKCFYWMIKFNNFWQFLEQNSKKIWNFFIGYNFVKLWNCEVDSEKNYTLFLPKNKRKFVLVKDKHCSDSWKSFIFWK